MTADGFRKAAAALFGDQWTVPEMADALEVGIRNAQQWESGEGEVPAGVVADIGVLLRQRRAAIDALLAGLE